MLGSHFLSSMYTLDYKAHLVHIITYILGNSGFKLSCPKAYLPTIFFCLTNSQSTAVVVLHQISVTLASGMIQC